MYKQLEDVLQKYSPDWYDIKDEWVENYKAYLLTILGVKDGQDFQMAKVHEGDIIGFYLDILSKDLDYQMGKYFG